MSQYVESSMEHGSEKAGRTSPFLLQDHANDARRSFFALPSTSGASFLGTTASGVVECLTSLATCNTSPSHGPGREYQAILTTAGPGSSEYTDDGAYAGEGGAPEFGRLAEPYADGFVPQAVENWLSGDNTESTNYMQSYPALQPTISASTSAPVSAQLTRVQPSTRSESMHYPSEQIPNSFPKTEETEATEPMTSIPAPIPQIPSRAPKIPMGSASLAENRLSMHAATTPISPTQGLVGPSAGLVPNEAFSASQQDSIALSPVEGRQTDMVISGPAAFPPTTHDVMHHHRHHHHHLHNQLPIASYMSEASLDLTSSAHQRPPAARRGPFKDHTERQKTAQTRKIGSCIRCRMQRIRCNADPANTTGECLGCKKSLSRTWRLPCLRLKISDVVLSKTSQVKGHEWTLRWKENTVLDDVGHWASSEVRIVRVSEGYTNEYVELRVRQFIPQDGDSLERSWVTPAGETRSVKIPPYAVIEPESIGPQYSTYIKKGLVACCNNVLSDHKSTLIWPTYWTAVNLSRRSTYLSDQERQLLSNTLDLWMTVRLTTRSFEIVGNETLGMAANILDETSPSCGKIPLPPVMGAQLDSVLIHQIQTKLRHDALDGLHKLVTENKARTWFTTYLVTFILLHNAALVIKHDASYARKHGIRRRFAREDKVQQYYTGAITLLAYFHYCNKGVFPFTEEAKDQDIRNLANLDENAMQFVRHTRKYAIANKKRWQTLWETNDYEDDFYFISQLFEANWQPRAMVM